MPIIGNQSNISIETVLFATDFSPSSKNAALYGANISRRFHAHFVVVHAFTLLQAAMAAESDNRTVSQQRSDLNGLLARTIRASGAESGESETMLIEGEPQEVIPALAAKRAPALIVLGTHGGNLLDRHLLGSVAEGILRNSSGPVLTVGPHVPSPKNGNLAFQKILYATDCSLESAHAAPYAVAFAEAFAAHIDVLNVVRPDNIEHPALFQDIQQRLYSALDAVVPLQARAFCDPRTFVSVGEPHRQILKHVEERGIDLLVLALRRNAQPGMQNRTSGAFPIIIKAQCPVLTVAVG